MSVNTDIGAAEIDYCVWVNSIGRADLGTGSDHGNNVFWSYFGQGCYLDGRRYAVYNDTSQTGWFYVDAVGNYWAKSCGMSPYIYGPVITTNPLLVSPWSGGTSLKRADQTGETEEQLGVAFVLENAYPNPLNASTTIRYQLGEPQKVSVAIYNVLGQRVRVLWDGNQDAGDHFLEWDGRNSAGQTVSSGVYFYRLTTNTQEISKKIALIK
jgi:hypothetical protein